MADTTTKSMIFYMIAQRSLPAEDADTASVATAVATALTAAVASVADTVASFAALVNSTAAEKRGGIATRRSTT